MTGIFGGAIIITEEMVTVPVFGKKNHKIADNNIYLLSVLIAIELFMSFSFLGYVHISPISITFAYIPVLVAGCLLGPKGGGIVGTVFGLASMWKASAFYVEAGDAIFSPVRSGSPIQSILLSVGARALFGIITGYLYKVAEKSKYPKTGIVLVSTIGRSIHTFCVYLIMGLCFPDMGYTAADTFGELLRPDYLIFVFIVDALILFIYKCVRSESVESFMKRIRFVDEQNAILPQNKNKLAILIILVLISSFSVAIYFTDRIENVMRYYGIDLSNEISYDLMLLQIQFLMGMISLAALSIIVIILYQKNSNYLYYEARLDGLTGLYGRQQFFQSGEEILRHMKFDQDNIGGYFVILDIDYFKEINDQYGHPAGDTVLKEVAWNLEKAFNGQGILGRLGGDEFVALIPKPASKEKILEILNVMKQGVSQIQTSEKNVTCSIGVIPIENALTIDDLYRNADRLLYEAKKNGKNQIAFGYRFK